MDQTPPYGPPVETTVPVWAKVGVARRSLSHQKNWREHFSWPPFATNAMRIVNGWQPCYFIYSAKPFSFNVLYFPLWKLCSAMFYWVAIEPDFPPVLVFCRLAVFLWQGNGDRLHLSVSFQTIFTQLTTLYFDSKSILSKCFRTKMIYFLLKKVIPGRTSYILQKEPKKAPSLAFVATLSMIFHFL